MRLLSSLLQVGLKFSSSLNQLKNANEKWRYGSNFLRAFLIYRTFLKHRQTSKEKRMTIDRIL